MKPFFVLFYFPLILCLYKDVSADDERYDRCPSILRMKILGYGPNKPAKTYNDLSSEGCNEARFLASIPLSIAKYSGALKVIRHLQSNHKLLQDNDFGLHASNLNPQACDVRIAYKAKCLAGITTLFDLDKTRIGLEQLKNKRVVSLGEGFSGQAIDLLNVGVDAYAVDYDDKYKKPENITFKMQDGEKFLPKQFYDHYQWGDATVFSKHPLAKQPFDEAISFCMHCNFDAKTRALAVLESVKAIKPGSELRLAHCHGGQVLFDDYDTFLKEVDRLLKQDGIRAEIKAGYAAPEYKENPDIEYAFRVVVIKRLLDNQSQVVQKTCE